ncbi:MAG: enoyl-CoA hydratase/isomerase family protein [Sulfitobacter sp.]
MKDNVNRLVVIETEGEIGLIRLAKPPVNAIGLALRTAIYEGFQTLQRDSAVRAIVLYGEGRFFSAGADIRDFGKADVAPTLPHILTALNDSEKPVIAALHGVAFGGALEVALAPTCASAPGICASAYRK